MIYYHAVLLFRLPTWGPVVFCISGSGGFFYVSIFLWQSLFFVSQCCNAHQNAYSRVPLAHSHNILFHHTTSHDSTSPQDIILRRQNTTNQNGWRRLAPTKHRFWASHWLMALRICRQIFLWLTGFFLPKTSSLLVWELLVILLLKKTHQKIEPEQHNQVKTKSQTLLRQKL